MNLAQIGVSGHSVRVGPHFTREGGCPNNNLRKKHAVPGRRDPDKVTCTDRASPSTLRRIVPMATEQVEECGDDLALLLEEGTSPEHTARIAKEIGFDDSPVFGARKKKARIRGEVAMINSALIIHAVNEVVNENKAKPIIDEFLRVARMYVFNGLEAQNPQFEERYPERLTEYFEILSQEKPALGLTFSFMRHLGVDPLQNLEGQLKFSAHILAMRKDAIAIVRKAVAATPDDPLVIELFEKIQGWPVDQQKTAVQFFSAVVDGDMAAADKHSEKLTFGNFEVIVQFLNKTMGLEPDR